MSEHAVTLLSRRYPQLLLPISDETRHSDLYRSAVLRGEDISGAPDFSFSPLDSLETAETPAGSVDIVTFHNRYDFEHCVRALAYRCEMRPIPPSMGASTVSGLINWEKIRAHKRGYTASGGSDWDSEFAAFTADSRNFRDAVIILSHGYYSALSPESACFGAEQWLSLSHEIRKYHELAHFVSRRLFPDNRDAVRDEVLADMNGIIAALGRYDAALAAKLLGVQGDRYVPGGRLENYVPAQELDGAVKRVSAMLDTLDRDFSAPSEPFGFLMRIEEEKLFL